MNKMCLAAVALALCILFTGCASEVSPESSSTVTASTEISLEATGETTAEVSAPPPSR